MRRLPILLAVAGVLLLLPVGAQADTAGTEHLKVNITGSGAGSVVVPLTSGYHGTPEVNCTYKSPGPATGVCETLMSNEGEGYEAVLITAEAAAGSQFVKWEVNKGEGEFGCTPPGNSVETCFPFVEPEESFGETTEVTAIFAAAPPLTIAKTGEGSVVSSPAGIVCTGAKTGAECEHNFGLNEMVTLTASPAAGYAFSAWGGCTEHAGLTCKVKMEKAKTVKAAFVATPSLAIEKSGSGYGKVAATGISCDESCSKEASAVKTGTSVTVKTTPAKGNEAAVLEGGTGSASSCSGSTCTFTIEANSSLKVKFNPIPSKTLTVKLTGPGAYKGKVSGKGITVKGLVSTAILCGTGCTSATESFFATGETELVASTVVGYKFAGWTVSGGSAGNCTGTTSPCKLATDANKTVEAKFE